MNIYLITITYTSPLQLTDATLQLHRKAASEGDAIAAASALFTALSNLRIATTTTPVEYYPFFHISEITATLVA